VSPNLLSRVAALATLPVVLSAAETVEWATCDQPTLELALGCWHVPIESPQQTAEHLFRWWRAYDGGSTTWPVAWRALESLLR
jgi:hypothetical protein